ncbi:MAG: hypothetical protein AAF267_20240 [Deinococcota bacterium]
MSMSTTQLSTQVMRTCPSWGARAFTVSVRSFAVLGVIFTGLIAFGIVADGLSFDQTQGGYEPPYTDFTGEPIDWTTAYRTDEGFFNDGYVVDVFLNCSTGMVSFEVFQQRWNWQELSDRALVVHQPAEACRAAGFSPEFE